MPAFRIRQNGQTVAQTEGPWPESEAEIMLYAGQYREDGELTVQVRHELPSGPSWKRHAHMAQYPQPSIIP